MKPDEWAAIPGYSDRYEISRAGEVRRKSFVDAYGHRQKQKVLSASFGNGYATVFVMVDQVKSAMYVHRLLAHAFIPNPRGLPQVNHIDGNKRNNALDNLEWVTSQGNALHARKAGLKKQKLTPSDVIEIQLLHKPRGNGCNDSNTKELARLYEVTPEQIRNVASGRQWSWLES